MTEVKIIAHRGASQDAPENTAAAIRLGWEQQADAVEIDVYLSKDREIVVMHDSNTRRTTGFDGEISDLTLIDLRQLDAGVWKGDAFIGESIPKLDEVLALLPSQKIIFIEIKMTSNDFIEPLRASLERSTVPPEHVFLMCFDYTLMKEIKTALPQMGALWLHGSWNVTPVDEMVALCRSANLDGLNLDFEWPIDAALVRQVKSAGLKMFVWTVDNSEVACSLKEAGVDGITTNRPGWIREQLQQKE